MFANVCSCEHSLKDAGLMDFAGGGEGEVKVNSMRQSLGLVKGGIWGWGWRVSFQEYLSKL